MKSFIKNSYLFLIFFIILISKDYIFNMFVELPEINTTGPYVSALEKEINDLKEIINLNNNSTYFYGKTVLNSAYDFHSFLMIKTNEKVYENDLVFDESGLIGLVYKVYDGYAKVKLLTNKDTLMQVKVSSCYGLLKYIDGSLSVDNVNSYCNIKENDLVYTSNLMGFDENILVGTVSKINYDENLVNNTYEIKTSNDFNNLNYVVILSKGEK